MNYDVLPFAAFKLSLNNLEDERKFQEQLIEVFFWLFYVPGKCFVPAIGGIVVGSRGDPTLDIETGYSMVLVLLPCTKNGLKIQPFGGNALTRIG